MSISSKFIFVLLLAVPFAFAYAPESITDSCYVSSATWDGLEIADSFEIVNVCEGSNSIKWVDEVNVSSLGNVSDGEVLIGRDWVFVDSSVRPDLDQNAELTFNVIPYALQPGVLKDGTSCISPLCNSTYYPSTGRLVVRVVGFSNYTLQGFQQFLVYSDSQPELKDKVYQTIDLGDSHRSVSFACITQIFGKNEDGIYVLVQTNPERKSQGKWFGDSDPNQPESLGYFLTNGGIANVYFRDDNVAGYVDLRYVAQCTSNMTKLVYEEGIATRYVPVGRELVGRGLWLTEGSNASYLMILIIVSVLALWVMIGLFKGTFG